MKTNAKLVLSLLVVSLGAGCVGGGPNTTQGAVGGAAAGALLGGIIGNNRGSGNGASGAAIGAVAGGIAGGAIGNSLDHQRGTVYQPAPEQRQEVVVQQPPPMPAPPREVVTVRPAREAVWVDGYYLYAGYNRYEWVPGHWEIPPRGYRTYVRPAWQPRGGTYVYVRGYWR
jgi:outer membrane lipoprotein SlyB